jgi:hypothetical protein
MVITFMIHGDHVLGYLKDLDRNSTNTNSTSVARLNAIKTAYRYKMYEDMLVVPGGRHDVLRVKEEMGRISPDQRLEISRLFANVAEHIRRLGINAMPDYEYIIDHLTSIQSVYRGSSLADSGILTRGAPQTTPPSID